MMPLSAGNWRTTEKTFHQECPVPTLLTGPQMTTPNTQTSTLDGDTGRPILQHSRLSHTNM